jgi:hypothetical protein
MSAFGGKADMTQTSENVSFGSLQTSASQKIAMAQISDDVLT